MAFVPDTQQGATVAFSGLSMDIAATEIPAVDQKIPMIDATVLGTTGQRIYVVGDLSDTDEFTVVFQNDGTSNKPTLGTMYTVTLTAPMASGDSSAEYWAGTCVVTGIASPQFSTGANALQTVSVTCKPDGGFNGGTAWSRTVAS